MQALPEATRACAHNYHDEYGSFPPADAVATDGRASHSWRTALLPFVDQAPLFKRLRLTEPWDSEYAFTQYAFIDVYACPSDWPAKDPNVPANYVAVVGEHTAWHGATPVSLDDITDGADRTILLVEVAPAFANWFEPVDLEFGQRSFVLDDPKQLSLSSRHDVHVLLVDGSVKRLPATTPPDVVKALLTIDGGEQIELPWLE